MSGSMSGMWKRGTVWIMRHRQTKGPDTDRPDLNNRATSRLYSLPGSASPRQVSGSIGRDGRYTTKWWCHAVAGCWPVGSRTGAVFRRSSLAVAPRFLATQRDHKLRQYNLSVVSARDELRQTIAILGWRSEEGRVGEE